MLIGLKTDTILSFASVHRIILCDFLLYMESKSLVHPHSGPGGENEDIQAHLLRFSDIALYQCNSDSLPLVLQMNGQIV
jgi:hypothetical protein